MNPGGTDSPADPLGEVQRALRMARRELRWVLTELEHTKEALQRTRRQRARLRDQVDTFSDSLATCLSRAYWAEQESRDSGVGRLVRRRSSDSDEAALVREVEASATFDGGWYLRTHPVAARSGLNPALHLVRHGNAKRLDPGPSFSTGAYLERHPEAAEAGVPALLHALRHDRVGETSDDASTSSPASDLHL